ncbi:MAG: hypothetical protein RBT57_08470 [Paludibacter sp.]|nr:hypothetical protein [Paludibacter sp.]
MDKNYLLETAKQLKQVNAAPAEEYRLKMDQLVAGMNNLMLGKADIEHLVGKDNVEMMKDNHSNHARFMYSIFKNNNPEVLVETVLWVYRAYRSHGFTTNYWATQLNAWITVLKESLTPESYTEIYPYYEWMQVNIPIFVKVSDEKLEGSLSMH